jgi:uncharacterized protein (TIGR03435 family)
VENQTLRNLIKVAYNVQDFQLLGGPAWINSDRYDIDARAQGNPPLVEVAGAMIQTLLEDRFRLAIHREKKELPVYVLSATASGLKVRPAGLGSCSPDGLPSNDGKRPDSCGRMRVGATGLRATSIHMKDLTETLESILRRTVVDETNFKYPFDAKLEYAPYELGQAVSADNTGPSVTTALREQLGLKLEPSKRSVHVIVIDRAERPGEN